MWLVLVLMGCGGDLPTWPEVAAESRVCLTVVEHAPSGDRQFSWAYGFGPFSVMAFGLDSQTLAHVVEIEDIGDPDANVISSIGKLGKHLYYCGDDRSGVSRVDMTTGVVERSGTKCEQVTDHRGGLVVYNGRARRSLTRYASWQDVLDERGEELEDVRQVTRFGRADGELYGAWHATDHLDRFNTVGVLQESVPLDYDGWVWGLSGTNERLVILKDHRKNHNHWYGSPTIAEFGLNGDLLAEWKTQDSLRPMGLSCTGSVNPNTFEPLDEDAIED